MDEPEGDLTETEERSPVGRLRWYYLAAVALVLGLLAVAQALYTSGPLGAGSLIGTVTDVEDQPLPAISVRLSGVGEAQETVTDSQGLFSFGSLDAGNYRIEAWGKGYPLRVYEPVVIRQARSTNILVQLRLAVRERVEVAAPNRTDGPVSRPAESSDRP